MLSREQLVNELIVNGLTIEEFSKQFNVPRVTINYWIKKHNIKEELKNSRFQRRSLIGKVYDKLTVVSFAGTDAWNKSEWLCKCVCGKTVTVGISSLNQKHTRSCGCLRKSTTSSKMWKGYGSLPMDTFSSIKRNAISRNLKFDVTIEYLWELFQKQGSKCALSGIDISLHKHKRNGIRATASLDRIDNNLGYIEGNVQWVHKHINICKHTYSNQEFIQMCNNVATLHPVTCPHL